MKSMYARLSEVLEKMTSKQRDKFYESRKGSDPVEVQVNCAEAILAGKVKESTPIKKNNGASDNGQVTEFRESNNHTFTEEAEVDEATYRLLGLSESDKRRLRNLPPVGSPNLTPSQLREFRFLKQINLSEADALRGALKVA